MPTTLNCKATHSVEQQITYQWETSSINGGQWTIVSGGVGESLSLINSETSKKYRCIASNEAGRTISNASSVIFMGKLLYQRWYDVNMCL